MKNTPFGIEIEMTGITRAMAADITANHLNGRARRTYDGYDTYEITAPGGRAWKLMSDSSITRKKKENGITVPASQEYSVELVSPILTYENDIETIQELVRKLRKAGAMTTSSEGIHIHLDGSNHTPNSIKNFINIIASKNDLLYKALEVKADRARYCKKLDGRLIAEMKQKDPKTLDEIADIWYGGYYESRTRRYHNSRYHFLNLHSFFTRHHTVELRGFNSTLHAGKIRSFVVLALALNNQALTQKRASSKQNQAENEKFAMRTYLNRIGLIGDEFKNCREHLTKALDGCSAWRFGGAA